MVLLSQTCVVTQVCDGYWNLVKLSSFFQHINISLEQKQPQTKKHQKPSRIVWTRTLTDLFTQLFIMFNIELIFLLILTHVAIIQNPI